MPYSTATKAANVSEPAERPRFQLRAQRAERRRRGLRSQTPRRCGRRAAASDRRPPCTPRPPRQRAPTEGSADDLPRGDESEHHARAQTPAARENPGASRQTSVRQLHAQVHERQISNAAASDAIIEATILASVQRAIVPAVDAAQRVGDQRLGAEPADRVVDGVGRRRPPLRSGSTTRASDRRARLDSGMHAPATCVRSARRRCRGQAWPSPRIARIAVEMLTHCRRFDAAWRRPFAVRL